MSCKRKTDLCLTFTLTLPLPVFSIQVTESRVQSRVVVIHPPPHHPCSVRTVVSSPVKVSPALFFAAQVYVGSQALFDPNTTCPSTAVDFEPLPLVEGATINCRGTQVYQRFDEAKSQPVFFFLNFTDRNSG